MAYHFLVFFIHNLAEIRNMSSGSGNSNTNNGVDVVKPESPPVEIQILAHHEEGAPLPARETSYSEEYLTEVTNEKPGERVVTLLAMFT